jgi:hypothetical protein
VSALTGAVTAFGALAVLRGDVPSGTHCAASALDPLSALSWLRAVGMCELTVAATPIDMLRSVEDGVL